jgi:DnaJ-class molecular chaperone
VRTDCPTCKGNGTTTYFGTWAFSADVENYVPDEWRAECHQCDGWGVIEVDDEPAVDD